MGKRKDTRIYVFKKDIKEKKEKKTKESRGIHHSSRRLLLR
jgi:hypothetical protein